MKFGIFAESAKFSLYLRNFRRFSEIFAGLAKFAVFTAWPPALFLPSTASHFLHFALVFSLIIGLVGG